MDSTTALMYVNIALWFGIGAYVAYLATRQKDIKKKIDQFTNINDR